MGRCKKLCMAGFCNSGNVVSIRYQVAGDVINRDHLWLRPWLAVEHNWWHLALSTWLKHKKVEGIDRLPFKKKEEEKAECQTVRIIL